jgi:hypothetical protein
MDTARIDICYRPLRIGFAVSSQDRESFRKAARINFALWGGRFNPIVFADQVEQAQALIEVFRCDFIVPLGDSHEVTSFSERFPHLIYPFMHTDLFLGRDGQSGRSQVLDVVNLMYHWRDKAEWQG